jgi:hypothetical protein
MSRDGEPSLPGASRQALHSYFLLLVLESTSVLKTNSAYWKEYLRKKSYPQEERTVQQIITVATLEEGGGEEEEASAGRRASQLKGKLG